MTGETGLSGDALSRRRSFISRFQQVTGPVMAKGLEDTAFYTYFPLVGQLQSQCNRNIYGGI